MTRTRRSALYEGTVTHARLDATDHRFRYQVLMAWLDLAELPDSLDAHPLWSARRPAPVRFRRRDFHGPADTDLDHAVRDTVAAQLGERPAGPIRLLAHLRTWGWSFNPIAFYFVYYETDTRVETLVAEVTNTPWHERHAYVIAVDPAAVGEQVRFPKELHVSPFLDLDLDHSLGFTTPGAERVRVTMDDLRGDERVFATTLDLHRLPLDRATMSSAMRRHPLPAHRVSTGIYREALRLRLKQAPFRRHPQKVGSSRATASAIHRSPMRSSS